MEQRVLLPRARALVGSAALLAVLLSRLHRQPDLAQGFESVRFVRIHSTTLAHLLHGFVLLPSRISGKMIISLDTITSIAMLDVSFLSLISLPTTCLSSLLKCHDKPVTLHIPATIV